MEKRALEETKQQEREISLRAERDRMRRLFNRLEAAVTHHERAAYEGLLGPHDEALYVARYRILQDYAKGKG